MFISVIFFPVIVIRIMYALIFIVAHKRQRMSRNSPWACFSFVGFLLLLPLCQFSTIQILLMVEATGHFSYIDG